MIYTAFENLHSQQGQQHSIDWPGFCSFIQQVPAYPDKSAQPLIKLGTYGAFSRANDLLSAEGLELDYDDGQITPEQAADLLRAEGLRAIVCSTYTSAPDKPKWRAFLPLSKPYAAKHRAALVGAVDSILGHVIAPESYREKQIFFIGRNPESDYSVIQCEGECLDTLPAMQQAARDYLAEKKAEALAAANVKTEALQRARVEKVAGGQVSIIQSFNESYDLFTIIGNHGYTRKGKRYKSPTSQSGLAGINVLDCDDGNQRIFSHHSSDPLNTGMALDAFDCFCILEHGNNTGAAIQAAGNLLFINDKTLTEHNRNIYLLPKITEALTVIQPDTLKIVGKVARACSSLPDGFDLWMQWAGNKYNTRRVWARAEAQKPLKPAYILMLARERRAVA